MGSSKTSNKVEILLVTNSYQVISRFGRILSEISPQSSQEKVKSLTKAVSVGT